MHVKQELFKLHLIALLFLTAQSLHAETILLYGSTGWFGGMTHELLINSTHTVVCGKVRLENRDQLEAEILAVKPDCIVNAAGITGRPSTAWCNTHKAETVRANVIGALNLIDLAQVHNIHVTHFGTGCLYSNTSNDPTRTFSEEDEPNCYATYYHETKILFEQLLKAFPKALNLRFAMPVCKKFNKRCLIRKLTNFKMVTNDPVSISCLDELLPIAIDMTVKRMSGSYNFANPGQTSPPAILERYQKNIDLKHTYDINTSMNGARSNAILNTDKLTKLYPNIPSAESSIKDILLQWET